MIRIALFVCVASAVSACASHSHSPPKCDGYSRRPLNRSMWQWQEKGALKQSLSDLTRTGPATIALAFTEGPATDRPPAFGAFRLAGSCAG